MIQKIGPGWQARALAKAKERRRQARLTRCCPCGAPVVGGQKATRCVECRLAQRRRSHRPGTCPCGAATSRRGRLCPACLVARNTITGPTEARRLRNQAKRNGDPGITTRALYVRDRGRCALCGLAVAPIFGYSWARCPSVDHVVPITKGGPHTWANVRLAHVGCNAARRAA